MRDNIMRGRVEHGHARRNALEQAYWGTGNLELQLQNLIAMQTAARHELVEIRRQYAAAP